MRRVAAVCGAVAASIGAVVEARHPTALEDACQLVQHSAVLLEQPQQAKPSEALRDALRDAKSEWKQHKAQQLEKYEPQRAAELRKKRPKGEKRAPLSEEEIQALEREAQVARYGEPMNLIVRELGGREFIVKFHAGTRLQVLMHSVCKRLGLNFDDAVFQHREGKLDPLATPSTSNIVDQDVIEVDAPSLRAERDRQSKERAAALLAEAEARAKREKDEEVLKLRLASKLRTQTRNSIVQAEEKRKHDLKVAGKITLRFQRPNGGASVRVAVKRENWLQGTMDLVCKRLGIDPAKTTFMAKQGQKQVTIRPRDSASSLGLAEEETIAVTP